MKRILRAILKWTGRLVLLVLIGCGIWLFIASWRSTNDCEKYSAAAADPMKAIVQCEYGTPDVLAVREIEKPKPDDTQILVRVRAASLNPLDGHQLRGGGALRPLNGLGEPEGERAGAGFAG